MEIHNWLRKSARLLTITIKREKNNKQKCSPPLPVQTGSINPYASWSARRLPRKPSCNSRALRPLVFEENLAKTGDLKMQCFICVTYMIFISSAHPGTDREALPQLERRSLFHDVIESLRIRSQLPEDFSQHDGNNLGQANERYGYENDPKDSSDTEMPNDKEFIPRRNDRIEMPPMKYRIPKSLGNDTVDVDNSPKEEIVLYIDTNKEPKPSTQKPKKQKTPKPNPNRTKPNKSNEEDEAETQRPDEYPWTNTMAGQSQIGNRESQMVVKPTVIVNIRGSVSHRDSDIKIEGRTHNDSLPDVPQNIFNIKQEIRMERPLGREGLKKIPEVKQEVIVTDDNYKGKLEEDMMMCETATWNPEKNERGGRKYDNVLQIMFSL